MLPFSLNECGLFHLIKSNNKMQCCNTTFKTFGLPIKRNALPLFKFDNILGFIIHKFEEINFSLVALSLLLISGLSKMHVLP